MLVRIDRIIAVNMTFAAGFMTIIWGWYAEKNHAANVESAGLFDLHFINELCTVYTIRRIS